MATTYSYTATTPTYEIDYTDQRFKNVEADKQAAIGNMENTYNDMISQSDKFYQDQINAAKDYASTQQELQQQNTDFAIEQINQQKDKANKDYTKEQSGAYTDWQKQSNQYGANAEQMAAQGMTNTGFSESSQVSMYNAYQNRVALARESYNNAVLNYDNAIKDAQLQNNAKLAEIAYNALQTELELALEGFQYKNTLLTDKANKLQELENTYYSRWQDVVTQMNTENAMAEQIRQYNESQKLAYEQFNEQLKQQEIENALKQQQYEESIRQFDEEIAYQKAKDTAEAKLKAQELELKKQQLKEEQRQFNAQLKEEQRQFNKTYSKSSGGGGGGGSSRSSGGSSSSISKSSKAAVSTDFYKGSKAKNVGNYGYFANGYQPKGVMVGGKARKLVSTGNTVKVTTKTLKGKKVTVTQKVWKASGTNSYFLWDGRKNKYVKCTKNGKPL